MIENLSKTRIGERKIFHNLTFAGIHISFHINSFPYFYTNIRFHH